MLLVHPVIRAREQLALTATRVPVLERLAGDASPAVRRAVAAQESCPAELLRQLSTDLIATVRSTVAGQLRTPRDAVLRLATDRSALVRWWALAVRDDDHEVAELQRNEADGMNREQARIRLGEMPD